MSRRVVPHVHNFLGQRLRALREHRGLSRSVSELLTNLETAKALGRAIPPSVLLRADQQRELSERRSSGRGRHAASFAGFTRSVS